MKISLSLTLVATSATTFRFATAEGEGVFSYDPNAPNGPVDWPTLDLGDTPNSCGGSSQSGIDIPTGPCDQTNADYIFEPGTCSAENLKFSISDHGIKAEYDTTNCQPPRMTIPSVATPFEALQFHIHTSSEHALDGTHFGAELHIVHQEVGGQGLAVLGLFLDPHSFAETNHFEVLIPGWEDVAAATSVLCGGAESNSTDVATTQGLHRRRHLTRKDDKTKQRKLSQSFNPYDLIPEGATFYYYSGSLTTPPCSEIVSWNVVDTPVSLSVREFLALDNFILDYVSPETCELATVAGPAGGTSRPTQPINGRTITHKCPSGTESRFPTEEASSTQSEDDAQPNSTDTNSGAATIAAASGLIGTLAMTLMVML